MELIRWLIVAFLARSITCQTTDSNDQDFVNKTEDKNVTTELVTIDVREAELSALGLLMDDVGSRPAWLCQITQLKNLYYYYGVIGNQYTYGINSLGSCLYQCVSHNAKRSSDDETPECKSVNYFTYHKACQILSEGIADLENADWRTYGRMDSVIHAYIQFCYDPAVESSPSPTPPVPVTTTRPPTTTGGISTGGVGCGLAMYSPLVPMTKPRIIGGNEANPHSWPWMVIFNLDMGQAKSFCGGTLLRVREDAEESDIVLTAAHCVTRPETQGSTPTGFDPAYMSITAGSHRRSVREPGEQQRRVSEVRFHAGFRFTPYTGAVNDVAVLKLQRPIAFNEIIRPVCLPEQGDAIPHTWQCVAAGWGRNDSRYQYVMPDALQQLPIPLQDAATCFRSWPGIYKENEMLCAGALSGTAGTCQGDSGGMLTCKASDGRWMQFGTTSFGVGGSCLQPHKPAVFARVSNYISWIRRQISAMSSLVQQQQKSESESEGAAFNVWA